MTRVDPEELPWVEPVVGVRYKAVLHNGQRVRLVEFAEGFQEEDWCRRGHIGYIVSGRLEVAFTNRIEVLHPGDFVLIRAGEQEKHRARVLQGPVRVFLVEAE